jgi:hypothetical protein
MEVQGSGPRVCGDFCWLTTSVNRMSRFDHSACRPWSNRKQLGRQAGSSFAILLSDGPETGIGKNNSFRNRVLKGPNASIQGRK